MIFTDPSWYWGYINSITYVVMNTGVGAAFILPSTTSIQAIQVWEVILNVTSTATSDYYSTTASPTPTIKIDVVKL